MSHCIPLHLVCDSIEDCSEAADEQGCSSRSCPGLLYCREDDICVHPLHICDGIVNCMVSMDDEAFCDVLSCPSQCQCQGYAVYCLSGTLPKNILPKHIKILILDQIVIQDLDVLINLRNLFYVTIYNVYLPYVPATFLSKLPHLIYLNMANNSITSIQPHTFKDLVSLKNLTLSANQLRTLQSHSFDGLFALLNLDLSNLYIGKIDKCAFCYMMHLETLNLSGNKITHIFAEMFEGMAALRVIDLSHNYFKTQSSFIDLHYRNVFIFHATPYCCTMSTVVNCQIALGIQQDEPSCDWVVQSTWYNIVCCCIAAATLLVNTLLCYYHRTDKHKAQYVLQSSLHFVNSSGPIYCLLITWIHLHERSNAAYLHLFWAASQTCNYFKVLNLVSFLLSNYVILLNAVNFLILTRYSLVRPPLTLTEVLISLGIGVVVTHVAGVSWVQVFHDPEPLCFPLFYGKSRFQNIAISMYMLLNLIVLIAVSIIYQYIGRYVADCAVRANQRRSSRGMTEQIILTICSVSISWSSYNILNWLDVIVDKLRITDLRFVVISIVISCQSLLCWTKYVRKYMQDKKRNEGRSG